MGFSATRKYIYLGQVLPKLRQLYQFRKKIYLQYLSKQILLYMIQ